MVWRMNKTNTAAFVGSSSPLVLWGVGVEDIGAIVGIILGVLTFLVNWYYKHKESKKDGKRDKE